MGRPRTWTDDQLIAAVEASSTMAEVHRRLGLNPGRYDAMRGHIARLGLDASHIPRAVAGDTRRTRRWTDDDLRTVVASSTSMLDVLRRLDYAPNGGMYRFVARHIRLLDLDTSHFLGQGWALGRRFTGRRSLPLSEVLVQNSPNAGSGQLRKRLIKAGLKPDHCEDCGLREWRGQPLPLALDHINGDHTDNRLENLRILCPNCHALTATWCGKSRSRRTPIGSRGSV